MTHPIASHGFFSLLRARHREGIAALPSGALRRWRRAVAIGFIGLIGLIAALVEIGKTLQRRGALDWEPRLLEHLRDHGPFTLSTAVWWQTFGTDITLVILVALTAGIAVWSRKPLTAWSIILAFLVMDPIVRVGWMLWDRERPRILYNGIASPAFHSFPSGHTGKTLAVYGILTFIWVRASRSIIERVLAAMILAAIAFVVPLGRVSMGVHWPTDVIAGWTLGLYWLIILATALRYERRPVL